MRLLRIDRLCGPPRTLVGSRGSILAARCYVAATPWARLVGLLATADLDPDEALWLSPCRSVHGVGLRTPIACALLDGDGLVIRLLDPLPRRRVVGARGAATVVECAPGRLRQVVPGDRLALAGSSPAAGR